MNVRFLAVSDAPSLRARFGDALSAADAGALAASADARLLVLGGSVPPGMRALLRDAGVTIAVADDTALPGMTLPGATLLGTTRVALERVRERASGDDAVLADELLVAFARASAAAPALRLRDRVLDMRDEARVMGIVNVTPDSFYERVDGAEAAVAKARAMAADGAALIDVGGQSYAAGNGRVPVDEERARVVPAVRAIAEAGIDAAISVDTFTASVADAALAAGAHLVNDCSGLSDPALPEVVAKHGAALVVMHVKGTLNVREPERYVYHDALAEIVEFLYERTERAVAGGVARDAI
ncbi:MAG: dihydropteroate synthase, partial [Candidatus Eremiobacteraeota bacterium]|nr:dihydropteroate synthase [Candidatus Eremiobacteraeota bacterium]